MVFLEGNSDPLHGAEVFVKGVQSEVTNENGAVFFELNGNRYTIIIAKPGLKETSIDEVQIVSGEVTEMIVTLDKEGGAPNIDIEVALHKLAEVKHRMKMANQPKGKVAGIVQSIENEKPVVGVRVFVKGMDVETTTDAQGAFRLALPVGIYALSAIHAKFSTQTIPDVEVLEEKTTDLVIELAPQSLKLAALQVVRPHIEGGIASLLKERRETSSVSDVIGAEAIAKTGDSSAAGALKRVTGLTVVGGKYVYVRGMGERYSSTFINGSSLPSPEPERRVVPLDMFPTGILKSVVIQKTYSPNLPGEFGGGAILLRTKGRPEKFTLDVSFSIGYKPDTTGKSGLTYKGGTFDWFGVDDGTRSLPSAIRKASSNRAILPGDRFGERGYTTEELERFGEMMPNIWNISRKKALPDLGFSLTIGDTYEIGETPLGFLVSFSYDNSWTIEDAERTIYIVGQDDQLEMKHSYDFERMENEIDMGTILDVSTDLFKHHTLKSTTLVLRNTSNEARIYSGNNRDVGTEIRVGRLRWIERMLVTEQITGSHFIEAAKDLRIDWHYAYSLATRHEPDRREYRKDNEEGTDIWYLSDRPEGNQRLFSELFDNNHDAALHLSVPFPLWNNLEGEAIVGGSVSHRDRNVDTRRFKYVHKGAMSNDSAIQSLPMEDIFAPKHIGADGFQFEETTRQTDNYDANQTIAGVYVMTRMELWTSLSLEAGLRIEYGKQQVRTFELFNPENEPITARLVNTDYLPSAVLTWGFYENLQMRAGYSITVSRPDFRELSPATFNDVTGGRQIYGNENLKRAMIQNADLRFEWYPSKTESISLSGFFKSFKDPIEIIVVPSAQQSVTYNNAKAAMNVGAEFEIRKNWGFMHERLSDVFIAGNATYIYSRITLDENAGVQTSDKRALQGQSPYVFNAQLGYDNVDIGTSLALTYNVFGPRISEVGAQKAPDVIEQPFHQLDFVYAQKLPLGFKLKVKMKNLVDGEVVFKQGRKVTERYRRGRAFSLSLGWAY